MSIQQNINQALGTTTVLAGVGKGLTEKIKTEKAAQETERLKQEQLAREAAQKQEISNIKLSPEQIAEAQNQGIGLSEMQEQIYYSDPQNLPKEVQAQRLQQAEEEYLTKESVEQLLGAYNKSPNYSAAKDQVSLKSSETKAVVKKGIKNRYNRRLEAKKGGKR